MTQLIPLRGGSINAHQEFSVQLGDNLIDFALDYLQSGQWSMTISRDGVTLAAGAMLEPNCDVIQAWQLDIGSLVFTGDDTTLDNLGANNRLVWVPPA